MKNFIKNWWDKLPEANSGAYELDKTILRALWKEFKSTIFLNLLILVGTIAGSLADLFLNGGKFGKLLFLIPIGHFAGSMFENIACLVRKLKKDYTK